MGKSADGPYRLRASYLVARLGFVDARSRYGVIMLTHSDGVPDPYACIITNGE